MTEYVLRIVKAANGWVVSNFDHREPGSMAKGVMVVSENQDLAGTIAAMLVAGRLDGEEPQPKKFQGAMSPSKMSQTR